MEINTNMERKIKHGKGEKREENTHKRGGGRIGA